MSALPPLRVLENNLPSKHPGGALKPGTQLPAPDVEREHETLLADLYAPIIPPDPALAHVRANFISTLDGSVTGSDGRSGSINGPADLRVFQLLRAQADGVFVGAGTARAEGYQDTDVPKGLRALRSGGDPQLITATRSGNLRAEFLDTNPIILTAENQPAAQKLAGVVPSENLIVLGKDEIDFPAALRELRSRGMQNILCEGGPHLMGSLIENHMVSELCLSFSPAIVGGDGPRIVAGALLAPTRARLEVLLGSPDGFLLSRWSLTAGNAS